MFKDTQEEDDDGGFTVSSRLFGVLIAGFLLVIVGIIVIVIAAALSGGSGSVGAVIFIGPIPIVFGAGPDAGWLILIGIVLAVLSLVLFYVMNRRIRWV